jgi:hypothetical protein
MAFFALAEALLVSDNSFLVSEKRVLKIRSYSLYVMRYRDRFYLEGRKAIF